MRRLAGDDPEVNEEWITDKDRFAFPYARQADRLTHPLVRDDETGELRPGVVARGVRRRRPRPAAAPARVGVLTGGRLTGEDAYAYSKFARVALGTNDIDFRARPHSAEEAEFLAAARRRHRPRRHLRRPRAAPRRGAGRASSPRRRPASIFLRLRKAVPQRGTRVFAVAPYTSRGLRKMTARLVPTAPGDEAAALDRARATTASSASTAAA